MSQQLPDPSTEAVIMWLKGLTTSDLKRQGWVQVNQQFHGIAMAMRPYLQAHFPDSAQQAAAFDGLVAGLMTLGHFSDVDMLATSYGHAALAMPQALQAKQSDS